MHEPMLRQIIVRRPTLADEAAFLAMTQASRALHHPWVSPPTTADAFAAYLARCAQPETEGLLVCAAGADAVMGAITFSQIFYGPLQSAYMGYYVGAAFAGRGVMRSALGLALDHAFGQLRLHRVEANIQPGNAASLALVRRLGFIREGFSRRYLFIDGAWRDHERFAMLVEDWAARRSS